MLFNSVHFLVFFPAVVLVYFVLPKKIRWVWLLVASYYFYMAWNPRYVLLLLLSTAVTFLCGLFLQRAAAVADPQRQKRLKRAALALSFGINLAILFFFKYFHFSVHTVNMVLGRVGLQLLDPQFDVLLPVGISFYTFQALGYTVDVYRGEIPAERNFAKYALFISFFPQLVAGPIERAKNLLEQVHKEHAFNFERVRSGLLLMAWGFFQKVAVADRLAVVVDNVYHHYDIFPGLYLVLATVLFAFQIYCDFAGYSNIARGAAQVLGFELMENFKQPYFARSVGEFWHRWHISLSTWFRDYVYIPLGGNRGGRLKKYRNVMLTFLASGLWHGASWNFVIWGGIHGLFQVAGDATRPWRDKLYRRLGVDTGQFSYRLGQRLVTFVLVTFAWVFFRAPGASAAFTILRSMFSTFNPWILIDGSLFDLGWDHRKIWLIPILLLVLLVVDRLQMKFDVRSRLLGENLPFRWAVCIALLLAVLLFGVYGPEYDPNQFLYFQF